MTTLVGKIEQSPSSKTFLRRSQLKLQRMSLVLPLAMLLFMAAVRGFSAVPATAWGVRTKPAIPITTTLSGGRRNIVGIDRCKIASIGSRTTTTLMAGLFGEQAKDNDQNHTYISSTSDWQIYVDQSKASLDRGGGAIFDAIFSLCDTSVDDFVNANGDITNGAVEVQVIPAILPKPASGGKGPWIRCVWNTNNPKNLVRPSPNMDVSNVDSVEKVYRVLTKHLGVANVSLEACECLKWKYKGNTYLESGEIKLAIAAYNQVLTICEDSAASTLDPNVGEQQIYNSIVLKQQEGIVLLLRASAFLQQAQLHKEALQTAIAGDETNLPSSEILKSLLSEAMSPPSPSFSPNDSSLSKAPANGDNNDTDGVTSEADRNDAGEDLVDLASEGGNVTVEHGSENDGEEPSPSLSVQSADVGEGEARDNDPQTAVRLSVLRKLQTNGRLRKAQLRKIQYRHGLYQTSLLQAASDSLRATEALPSYPTAWLRAGELLSDLWKIKESMQYYEKALSIDESLEASLSSVLEGLEARQQLVDSARARKEWPEDSLQLALDIAG